MLILKPDSVIRKYVGARVIKTILDQGYEIKAFVKLTPSKEFLAEEHYVEHKGRSFFNWLVDYMSMCDLYVMVLEGENVTGELREILGNTFPEKADPSTIRGKYGIYGGVNVAHASDSSASGEREVNLWSPIIEKYGVEESPIKYVEQYLSFPTVDVNLYRDVVRQYMEGQIDAEEARLNFVFLLTKETDLPASLVIKLADVIVTTIPKKS
ncbi:MAG: nucleoside-diphosphate kinase [Candidatus Heimdallarchaeaceae archaeon]